MNRKDYKVLVSGKKQAKQFKQTLKALGENVYKDFYDDNCTVLSFCNDESDWFCSHRTIFSEPLKEITFKELIKLLVNEEKEVSAGLLDGRVAIQVNNDMEFKLLMDHYKQKGWESITSQQPDEVVYKNFSYSPYISYNNKFNNPNSDIGKGRYFKGVSYDIADYKIIPFTDFAAEVGINVPVFVMKSEDGVDLYEGYKEVVFVTRKNQETGIWDDPLQKCMAPDVCDKLKNEGHRVRGFSTKEASEKWIEEQNKPKEISLSNMPNLGIKVFAVKNGIRIGKGFYSNVYKVEEVKGWLTAWKSLQD